MKLYYSAGSCSTSCHITLEESGLKYEASEIDWDNAEDPIAKALPRMNPQGTLPVLALDNGEYLTQNASIHTYVALKAQTQGLAGKSLLPTPGTEEYARAVNWLSFVSSDLHKSFSPLFGVKAIATTSQGQAEVRKWAVGNVTACFEVLDRHLQGKDYLMDKTFTVADAYCFVVCGWSKWLEVPRSSFKNLEAYLEKVSKRPAVQRVYQVEGLLD